MNTALLLPVLGVLASLSGVLLIAGLAGSRAQGRRDLSAHADAADTSGRSLALWCLVAALAATLPMPLAVAMFAAVSMLALAQFFAMAPRRRHDGSLRVACFVAVPLQYALVATNATELFAVALPLAATLVLPLLALRGGDTRDLLDRITECGWGVLVCVYCVSHAAAMLLLDLPGFAGRAGSLVAFLVIVAKADEAFGYLLRRLRPRTTTPRASLPRIVGRVAASALAAAALGALLAPLTPFTPGVAAAAALLIALLGALGRFVMACIERERPGSASVAAGGWRRALGRPDAIAFAAPVFYHLLRATYGP